MSNNSPRNIALSLYSLPNQFCEGLQQQLQLKLEFYSISELPKTNPFKLLRFFHGLKAVNYYIIFDTEEAKLLLPILRFLAFISFSRRYFIITGNGKPVETKKIKFLVDVFSLSMALLSAVFYVTKFLLSVKLQSNRRITFNLNTNKAILYLKTNFWFGVKSGGSIGHVAGVVNGFILRGWNLDYASIDAPVMLNDRVKFLQIFPKKILILPFEFNNYKLHYEFLSYFIGRNSVENYSFIYQRLSLSNFSGYSIAKRLEIPLVVEYNGSEVWATTHWGNRLILPSLSLVAERIMLEKADLVVTISDVLKEELVNSGISSDRIIMYPNCIDPENFNPARFTADDCARLRQDYGIPLDAIVITFVGTFGLWHGAEVLAGAIKELQDQHGEFVEEHEIFFLMVGNGSRLSAVKRIVGDNDRVIYTGLIAQDRAAGYLAASDIVVSPHVPNPDGSRFFGSPTKLFEYMAMGKAIIASRLEQIETVLSPALDSTLLPLENPVQNNRETAILCPPNNTAELVRAIQFLVLREDWRSSLGRNAHDLVMERYCWNHHVAAIEAGLQRLEQSSDTKSEK